MLGFYPVSAAPVSGLLGLAPYVPPVPGPGPFSGDDLPQPYDLICAFDSLLPGYVFEKADWDAMYAAWAANGFVPLTSAEALAYVLPEHGPQPPLVTSIPQMWGIDEAPLFMNPSPALPS